MHSLVRLLLLLGACGARVVLIGSGQGLVGRQRHRAVWLAAAATSGAGLTRAASMADATLPKGFFRAVQQLMGRG